MILRYLNAGLRRFGETPVAPHARVSWEFFAVVEGRCGLLLEGERKLPLQQSHLWILPPHHFHGWHGEPGTPCEIVVFHFASIPPELAEALPPDGPFECALTGQNCDFLRQLQASLEADFQKPTWLSDLRCHQALLHLTLLALNHLPGYELNTSTRKTAAKVDAALEWFRRHLRDKPSLEKVAKSIHVSPSHLRRMFAAVRHQTPSQAMQELKLEAAFRTLSETDAKIEVVASECGFSSASDFCRAFKKSKGCTPKKWRKQPSFYPE